MDWTNDSFSSLNHSSNGYEVNLHNSIAMFSPKKPGGIRTRTDTMTTAPRRRKGKWFN
jgi:hypothetical protein